MYQPTKALPDLVGSGEGLASIVPLSICVGWLLPEANAPPFRFHVIVTGSGMDCPALYTVTSFVSASMPVLAIDTVAVPAAFTVMGASVRLVPEPVNVAEPFAALPLTVMSAAVRFRSSTDLLKVNSMPVVSIVPSVPPVWITV